MVPVAHKSAVTILSSGQPSSSMAPKQAKESFPYDNDRIWSIVFALYVCTPSIIR